MLLLVALAHAADPTAAERVTLATRAFQQVRAQEQAGAVAPEEVYRWSVRLMEAERDAGVPDAARSHATRMRDLAITVADQVGRGQQPPIVIDMARFYELEAARLVGGQPARPPTSAPAAAPAPLAQPAAGAAAGDIDTCFQACDAEHQICAQAAEHFRLGMGALQAHAECDPQAAVACGAGRSQTATECRANESRACQAAKRSTECARTQTQCSARCR